MISFPSKKGFNFIICYSLGTNSSLNNAFLSSGKYFSWVCFIRYFIAFNISPELKILKAYLHVSLHYPQVWTPKSDGKHYSQCNVIFNFKICIHFLRHIASLENVCCLWWPFLYFNNFDMNFSLFLKWFVSLQPLRSNISYFIFQKWFCSFDPAYNKLQGFSEKGKCDHMFEFVFCCIFRILFWTNGFHSSTLLLIHCRTIIESVQKCKCSLKRCS